MKNESSEGETHTHTKTRLQKAGKTLAIAAVTLTLVAIIALGASFYFNEYSIQMSIPAEETVVLEYGESYDDSDVTAWFCGTIWEKSGFQIDVQKSGEADTDTVGEYSITYTASYKGQTAVAVRNILVEDREAPVITLAGDPDSYTNPNDEYIEEGYTAVDNYDGDLTEQVIREERDGVVTYTVEDSSGNCTTVTREIVYRDTVAPVLTLEGETEITLEAGKDYSEPGYAAADDCDGDLTDSVLVAGTVDSHTPGIYELTYEVKDSSGNSAQCIRTVTVQDTTSPVLSVNGDSRIYVLKGSTFSDPGVTAKDACDGDLTEAVTVSSSVDTKTVGVYTVSYMVADSSGNQARAERTVYVYEETQEETETSNGDDNGSNTGEEETTTANSGNTGAEQGNIGGDSGNTEEKVIYLTFDDGPGQYTEKLLDILDKYDVKVTFFVTNQYPKYQYLIAEEAKRGHTVAIHSYSHKYSTIYASENAFYEDLNRMNDIIYQQTGSYSTIVRFPGGSSNTVSKKYCEGIMTALTESLGVLGYQYADWNVSSGDAGETKSTSTVVSNVISGIKKHKVSVVLQHDIHGFSVDAVEEIIVWALDNGYTFRAMDAETTMVHHRVNN